MNMNIVDRIKALCDGKQITIMQLEAKLGISNGTISKWRKSSPKLSKEDIARRLRSRRF